jgi:hypothetical protein
MDELFTDSFTNRMKDMMNASLKNYGRRTSQTELLATATLVADAYAQCQEQGASFRAWAREHMSVSMPTVYTLLKIGQNMDQVLEYLDRSAVKPVNDQAATSTTLSGSKAD